MAISKWVLIFFFYTLLVPPTFFSQVTKKVKKNHIPKKARMVQVIGIVTISTFTGFVIYIKLSKKAEHKHYMDDTLEEPPSVMPNFEHLRTLTNATDIQRASNSTLSMPPIENEPDQSSHEEEEVDPSKDDRHFQINKMPHEDGQEYNQVCREYFKLIDAYFNNKHATIYGSNPSENYVAGFELALWLDALEVYGNDDYGTQVDWQKLDIDLPQSKRLKAAMQRWTTAKK